MQLFRELPGEYYAASTAILTGDLVIGRHASFWFGSVVRGDLARISLGQRVNVQDQVIIHCDVGVPIVIEDDVSIGHRAVIHGHYVGAGSLIGIGAVLLSHSRIGRNCLVAAGAVVPPELVIPDNSVVMGVPGRIVRSVSIDELNHMQRLPSHYVQLAQRYLRGAVSVRESAP